MTITLFGADLDWLRRIYDCMVLSGSPTRVPDAQRRKLLQLHLIDERDGSVTEKGHEELKRHGA
jgi:hypothetical protein